jgi:hypothetical protein
MVSKMPLSPTTVHTLELTQEAPDKVIAGSGSSCLVQVAPLSVVLMIADPTALQSDEVTQDTASMLLTLAGTVCANHVSPPFVVATISGTSGAVEIPVTMQSRSDEQLIALNPVTPVGTFSVIQVSPPSTVPMMPASSELTAQQIEGLTQATPSRVPTPGGGDSLAQVEPPFAVAIITGLPK